MNILIPHTWLLEHVDTKATPTEIQKYISLCGPSVERIYEREGDSVYDIEVTTNRVDSMSVRGIAREVAVILPQFKVKAKLKPEEFSFQKLKVKAARHTADLRLPKIIDDQKICGRIMCIALANVERAATPEWMAKRLRQTEMNVHDVVIDITNYITHELGHPCHAFDYDKIMELGGTVIVTTAKKGKKFTTLDGVTYTTVGGEVVYENQDGLIIDLPGIKGTANTAISESTKNVLFWLENLAPEKVRFTSMTHAIRTTAAQLNERKLDPHLAADVLARGVQLFEELAGAKIASPVFDKFFADKSLEPITVPLQRVTDYLGIELDTNTIADILEKLDCHVELRGPGHTNKKLSVGKSEAALIVTPPTSRPDMTITADVIEEIARIYGYHNLPSVIMPTAIPLIKPTDTNFAVENRLKRFLAAIGWQEVYTYSMVSAEIAEQSGFSLKEHVAIQNPLTDDRMYLRRSLLPSLEEVITTNPQQTEVSVFELANIYTPISKLGELPAESLRLGFVSTQEFRKVKGIIEEVFEQFFTQGLHFVESKKVAAVYTQSADIFAKIRDSKEEVMVGTIGILKSGHVGTDVDVKKLLTVFQTHPRYQPQPKTSEIIEDLTIQFPGKTPIGPVIEALATADALVTSVTLSDLYQQNYTFRVVYHDPNRSLTAEEISPLRKKIVDLAVQKFAGQLIGSLT